ncbi:N-acylneuraminate cytidylyltransferase-like isoform X1 [Branchiostoma floridae x Branchiostoma japonicum]
MSFSEGPEPKKPRTSSSEIQTFGNPKMTNNGKSAPDLRYKRMGFEPTPELRAEWKRRFGKEEPHIATLILARGGSKGIPMKNNKKLGGLELIGWVIRAAIDSDIMDSVWVSTDHDDIAATARKCGAQVHRRSAEVSQDTCNSWVTIDEFAKYHPEVDIIVDIQATSPCLHPFHLHDGMRLTLKDGYDSVFTVVRRHGFRWTDPKWGIQPFPLNFDPAKRPRRQEWNGEIVENGAFYMMTRDVEQQGLMQGGKMAYLVMEPEYGVDIDTDLDWEIAEQRLFRFGYHGRTPKTVKLVVVNIDGTLLDGQVQVSPTGEELRSFKTTDIVGVQQLRENGIEFRVVAEGDNEVQRALAGKLSAKLEENCTDKLTVIDAWRQELGLEWKDIGYMGYDISDMSCIKKAGMSACPSDAYAAIQKHSHFISTYRGGQGALREFCEQVLEKGNMAAYVDVAEQTWDDFQRKRSEGMAKKSRTRSLSQSQSVGSDVPSI